MSGSRLGTGAANGNGVYRFDSATVRVGLITVTIGLLLFGSLGIVAIGEEPSPSISSVACLLTTLGLIACLGHILRLSGRTLRISDDGIAVQDKKGHRIGSLHWSELGSVSERRKMAQLALWDKSGTQRVLIDQQFENFSVIRSRIMDEYAKVFTLKPLPIEFRNSNPLLYDSFIFAVAAAFFAWVSWRTYQEGQTGLSVIPLCFSIASMLSLLSLYPQLRGPSELFEDRIVLRSLFKTEELYKKNVIGVEIGDMANPRSGTKFSLIILRAINRKHLKITSKYGSIPEIYLTLRAWLAQK